MSFDTDADTRIKQRSNLARLLADSGLTDVLVTDRESAHRLLSEDHQELVQAIKDGEFSSVDALASTLERDVTSVRRDLDFLLKGDVIEYDSTRKPKILQLKHSFVIAEPLVDPQENLPDLVDEPQS
ncbi:MAG: hypothetical protein ABEJ59_05930 [Halanaeroarchaeum sp.]